MESNDSSTNELSLLQSYFYNESALMSRLFFLTSFNGAESSKGFFKRHTRCKQCWGLSTENYYQLRVTIWQLCDHKLTFPAVNKLNHRKNKEQKQIIQVVTTTIMRLQYIDFILNRKKASHKMSSINKAFPYNLLHYYPFKISAKLEVTIMLFAVSFIYTWPVAS